ncbi:MAG TPA: 50S ribosomal protein L24 [Pirellulaceae bacterium]
MHIQVEDMVEVITGDDRAKRARVLSVDRARNKVVVEGVNLVYKHVRKSQRNPQGGRLSKEMPVPISNVLLVCGKCNKATRTGSRYTAEGAKVRYCRKCGAEISALSPPRKAYAKSR